MELGVQLLTFPPPHIFRHDSEPCEAALRCWLAGLFGAFADGSSSYTLPRIFIQRRYKLVAIRGAKVPSKGF